MSTSKYDVLSKNQQNNLVEKRLKSTILLQQKVDKQILKSSKRSKSKYIYFSPTKVRYVLNIFNIVFLRCVFVKNLMQK